MIRILRALMLGGLFCLPLSVFLVSWDLFFPFVTGKAFAMRILIEWVACLGVILCYTHPALRPRKGPILIGFSVLIAFLFFSNAFGVNFHQSFWGRYERMDGWLAQAHFFLLFLFIPVVLRTEKNWISFFLFSSGCAAVVAIHAVLQKFGIFKIYQSYLRVDSTFGHASFLANYLLFHLFLTFFLFYKVKNKGVRLGLGLAFFLQSFALYYTATRGAQVALIGALLFIALLNLKDYPKRVVITLVCLACSFLLLKETNFVRESPVLSRFIALREDLSANTRLRLWEIGWEAFKEHPFLGWGQESFFYIYNRYYNPEMFDVEEWFDRSHNYFLDWLTQSGSLGLIAYLTLYLLMARSFWKSSLSKWEKKLFLGLLSALLIHQFFLFEDLPGYLYFCFLLAYAHSLSGNAALIEEKPKPIFIPSLVSFSVLGCSLYFLNFFPLCAAYHLSSALVSEKIDPQKSLHSYKMALQNDLFGKAEIREELVYSALRAWNDPNLDAKLKAEWVALTQKESTEGICKDPKNLKLILGKSKWLQNIGSDQEAYVCLQQALALSPNKQPILADLVRNLLQLHQFEEAFQIAKRNFELAPRNPHSAMVYGVTAIFLNKNDLAENLFLEVFKTPLPCQLPIAKAYFQTGQLKKCVSIYQQLVNNHPENIEYLIGFIEALVANRQPDVAVEEIKKAVQRMPALKEVANSWLEQIKKHTS